MNDRNDIQHPDPKFVEHLEWQLRSEFRRQARLAQQPAPWWKRRGWRAAALASVSLLVGFGGATAAQETNERLQQRLIEAESRLQLEMARQQMLFAEEQLAWTLEQQEAGTASDAELADAELGYRRMQRELELMRREFAYQERTGERPRHDLAAPPIDGRDFVSARLELQRDDLNDQVNRVNARMDELVEQERRGTINQFEVMAAELMRQNLTAELDLAHRLLQLRRDFLEAELTATELQVREELLRARTQAEVATGQLNLAQAHLNHVLETPGLYPQLDLRAAEFQVTQAQLQAEMATLRLRLLRQRE